VLSLIDNQRYCKVNGAFKRHLAAHNISEEEYLLKYELEEAPKCIICGKLPQLFMKWQWKQLCTDKACLKAFQRRPLSDEHKAAIGAASAAKFADKEWAAKQQAKMHAGNQVIGKDGLTGYERTKKKREVTMLEKYGHAQYANWEKTKQTWADKSDEEKDKYARETSERQRAFSPEKRAEITNRVVAGHIKKYGVACPANLKPQFGSSKIASALFSALDSEHAEFKPKTAEHAIEKLLVDFRVGAAVIEFYGDYWHANPQKFKPEDVVGKGKWPAKSVWQKDAERIAKIEAAGYKVKVVWERDYRRNPERAIQECKEFLSAIHQNQ
jgi:G:T-mismatch repair DNA endonuclease (very short patch repair protein)